MAKTTRIKIDGDYFVADLDNGGVRVGLKGAACLDISPTHKLFAPAKALKSVTEADEFFSEFCAPIILGAR